MGNRKPASKKDGKSGSFSRYIIICAAAVIILAAVIMINGINKSSDGTGSTGDVVINKSEISETVSFFPVKIGKTNMEVMAVKASDGTIRTAFNTCQVCNGSPWAYFKQEGNMIVCQNCGNVFSLDMIEVQRGGCNPVPITGNNKLDNGDTIIISREFLEKNKGLFPENWKSR